MAGEKKGNTEIRVHYTTQQGKRLKMASQQEAKSRRRRRRRRHQKRKQTPSSLSWKRCNFFAWCGRGKPIAPQATRRDSSDSRQPRRKIDENSKRDRDRDIDALQSQTFMIIMFIKQKLWQAAPTKEREL